MSHRQIVNLGSGFDTRPYRLEGLKDVDYYEVDQEKIHLCKELIHHKVGCEVTFLKNK